MNFQSFLLSQSSIIGHHASDISEHGLYELFQKQRLDKSLPRDDSFFKTDDPATDPISVVDVMISLPFGKYQRFMTIFYLSIVTTTAFLSFNFAFFLMPPVYKCPYQDALDPSVTLYRHCTRLEICALESDANLYNYVDWDHRYSLNNWISKFELYCGQKFEIGLFGSIFFVGFICSCLIFPPLADAYGRKKFAVGVCAGQLVCFAAMIFIQNQMVYYVAIFLVGFSVPCKAMIAYTHLMEFLPGRVSTVSGFVFFLDGMVLVVSPLILLYITKNTDILLYIPLFLNILGLIVYAIIYIPESVKYLLEKGKYVEAKRDIEYIFKFNNATEGDRLICLSMLERYVKKKESTLEKLLKQHQVLPKVSLFKRLHSEKNVIHNLIMMIFCWIAASFCFFLLTFLIKYMPGDIFFNSIVSGLSGVALLVEGKLQSKLDLRGGQAFSFFLLLLASVLLCFFDQNTEKILIYAFILLLAKCGANLSIGFSYAMHQELFPHHFIITSYGICNFFCRGITIFAPLVAEFENQFVPLFSLVGLGILGVISSALLRKKPKSKPIRI